MHYGDLIDATNLIRIIQEVKPNEIYNLAAQSHVKVSFETPEYTANSDALGALRILEAIRILNLEQRVKFYQASTSEMYGNSKESPQNENTPFCPRSPYAAAKVYAYWITVNYREAYNIFACNGILFNHESPIRGETFVTRKITRAVARIALGLQNKLYIGNLDAKRDWGYAGDYVRAMWAMLQQPYPDDFVIATGENHSVREFVEKAFLTAGIQIEWTGKGTKETGIVKSIYDPDIPFLRTGDTLICVDPRYFRPTEVENLLGDPSKAKEKLNWKSSVSFNELVEIMVKEDLIEAKKDQLCNNAGFKTYSYLE
jgi:GDPmannose 4,6-dehydratase